MSNFSIKGTIKKIFPLQQISDKFNKQEFVLETIEDKYPQLLKFQCTQDRCNVLVGKEEGQKITVHFNLRGREWINKENKAMFFNSLDCWKIEAEQVNTPQETIDNDALPF
jgi:hypothetical protein